MQASRTGSGNTGNNTGSGSSGEPEGSTENSGVEVVKYYIFNGQKIAMRTCPSAFKTDTNCQFRYLHGDHLGSILMTTDLARTGSQREVHRRYDAYGLNLKDGTDDLATDHGFTGQKADGTGLMYYNARYYDPQLGMFISPDSIVPDPTNVFAYNRYMYVYGNPLKYSDPTGHKTSKPDGWPDWQIYIFDLPDGFTMEDFREWVAENNIPTTVGGQIGFSTDARVGVGNSSDVEVGFMFNWWSGEAVLHTTYATGLEFGLPDLGAGIYGGISTVSGASSIRDSIAGDSVYHSYSLQAEAMGTAGINFSTYEGRQSDDDPNITTFKELNTPFVDPIFERTVNEAALNVTFGIDAASTVIDPSYGFGYAYTTLHARKVLYGPLIKP